MAKVMVFIETHDKKMKYFIYKIIKNILADICF